MGLVDKGLISGFDLEVLVRIDAERGVAAWSTKIVGLALVYSGASARISCVNGHLADRVCRRVAGFAKYHV